MDMHNIPADLARFLDELAQSARPGDRLPTIRELMHRFGVSQMVVQRAFQSLKSSGLVASQVGRGTCFVQADEARLGRPAVSAAGPNAASAAGPRVLASQDASWPAARSVLLLRRSISIARGCVVMAGLQRRFTADGHRVLAVSYTDPEHARTVLKGLQRFDACVVQPTFKTISIDLLAALRERRKVLAVDGAARVGTDVDAG